MIAQSTFCPHHGEHRPGESCVIDPAPADVPIRVGQVVWYLPSIPLVGEGIVTKLSPCDHEVTDNLGHVIKVEWECNMFPQTALGREQLIRAIDVAIFALETQRQNMKRKCVEHQ